MREEFLIRQITLPSHGSHFFSRACTVRNIAVDFPSSPYIRIESKGKKTNESHRLEDSKKVSFMFLRWCFFLRNENSWIYYLFCDIKWVRNIVFLSHSRLL